MSQVKWVLRTSLLKTLANKLKRRMCKIIKTYRVPNQEYHDVPGDHRPAW